MNHSRYLSDTRRSPYPRRRRPPVPRSPGLARSLPAITLLSPDGYHLNQTMAPRPLSPGAYRMIPPSSALHKMTSFVILNETISSPVASRAPSPSGRVSPFRGHGFKSPSSSRTNSRSVSPVPTRRKSAVVPVENMKIVHMDIGLPPKSPKKVLKTVQIKEFKPPIKPKPILKKVEHKPVPKVKVVSNKKPVVMSTVDKNKDKKSPAAPKNQTKKVAVPKSETKIAVGVNEDVKKDTTEEVSVTKNEVKDDPVIVSQKAAMVNESTQDIKEKKEDNEKMIPCFQPDKCYSVPPTMASPTQTTAVQSTTTTTSTSRVAPASLSAISSALSVTGTLSKKSLQPKPVEKPVIPKSPLVEEKIKPDSIPSQPQKIESAVATMTTVDEIIKSRIGSAVSVRSKTNLSIGSPTPSEKTRSSMVTVRAASSGSVRSNGISAAVISSGLIVEDLTGTSDIISTTKLIRVDSDAEVLSPNNLISSPPHNMREPLWQEDRVHNGTAPNTPEVPKTRCGRFWASVWRFISYIFCCCKRWSCCRSACCQRLNCKTCCKKKTTKKESPQTPSCKSCCSCSFFKTCFSKLNCCKSINCCSCCKNCKKPCGSCSCSKCCTKVKCCEGRNCCKKKKENTSASKMCCAKPCCSCKNCCASVKNCCRNCNDRVNRCCRSLFCLNFACCQRCLRRCSCCHKYNCCKKGGCCSCCNPNVKRDQKTRLDKKNSRASNQSKQERAKLDAALVDHSSMMKAAVPVLPICLAWLCLFFNIFIPGSGTLFSGILCLCFGKPRFSVNDTAQNRVSAFLVNFVIAVAQAFTIIFCLVGWGWSIWWGVIMVKLSRKQKRLKLAEKNQEISPNTVDQNHVDPERR